MELGTAKQAQSFKACIIFDSLVWFWINKNRPNKYVRVVAYSVAVVARPRHYSGSVVPSCPVAMTLSFYCYLSHCTNGLVDNCIRDRALLFAPPVWNYHRPNSNRSRRDCDPDYDSAPSSVSMALVN